MSAKYEPGMLAAVSTHVRESARAVRRGGVWHFLDDEGYALDAYVSDVRPLVVLDPDDREQIERLMRVVRDNTFESGDTYPGMGRFADAMQAALRSLIKPPKPAEPTGLGAVVEDASGKRYVRQVDGWWRGDEPCSVNWPVIDAVRVLSDGWEPKP